MILVFRMGQKAGLFRSLASTRFVSNGLWERCRKATRNKEWLVLSHSSNNMSFMIMTSSNLLSLETRRGLTITSRRQNVQAWIGNTPGSQRSEKCRMANCAGKVMATVFWDRRGVLLADFVEKATTINAASYYASLERLRTAIKKRLGMLTTGVMFLHDSVRTHVATATRHWRRFRWAYLVTFAIQRRYGAE